MIGSSLVAVLLLAAPQGLYFEQTTALRQQGVGAPGVRSRVWLAPGRMRLEAADVQGGPALVLRLAEGRLLRLDPASRTAFQLDAERLRARSAGDAAVAAGLMGGAPDERLRSTPLEGERTIAGHVCSGYRISGRSFVAETWVSAEVPARAAVFADFLEWSGAAQALSSFVDAVRALPGFPLETRLRMSVLGETKETMSTVTLIRAEPVRAELFEVPAGWRLLVEPAGAEVVP